VRTKRLHPTTTTHGARDRPRRHSVYASTSWSDSSCDQLRVSEERSSVSCCAGTTAKSLSPPTDAAAFRRHSLTDDLQAARDRVLDRLASSSGYTTEADMTSSSVLSRRPHKLNPISSADVGERLITSPPKVSFDDVTSGSGGGSGVCGQGGSCRGARPAISRRAKELMMM